MMWTLCGIEPTRFVGLNLVVSVFAGEVQQCLTRWTYVVAARRAAQTFKLM
jgi:hypothetical protein